MGVWCQEVKAHALRRTKPALTTGASLPCSLEEAEAWGSASAPAPTASVKISDLPGGPAFASGGASGVGPAAAGGLCGRPVSSRQDVMPHSGRPPHRCASFLPGRSAAQIRAAISCPSPAGDKSLLPVSGGDVTESGDVKQISAPGAARKAPGKQSVSFTFCFLLSPHGTPCNFLSLSQNHFY